MQKCILLNMFPCRVIFALGIQMQEQLQSDHTGKTLPAPKWFLASTENVMGILEVTEVHLSDTWKISVHK